MQSLLSASGADGFTCVVASASKSGKPDIAFKGSLVAFDHETLSYWERSRGTTMENIAENPQVIVLYRNPTARITWRIAGRATIHTAGETYQRVMDRSPQFELDRDPERKGSAVTILIDKILQGPNVIQER
jgi:hypothetical protein